MRRTATHRSGVLLLLVVALGLGASGCGSTTEDDYATGWDAICGDVGDAYRQFRTDLVSAATSSRDDGDAAASRPLSAVAVGSDLARPARKLERALSDPFRAAGKLDPPERWKAWHGTAVQRFAAQSGVVRGGLRRVEAGDADALPSLALGGFGPAAADAPGALRDRTPTCTALR